MCRLVAYRGMAIPLENIIVKPAHSLLVQSHDAHEAKLSVNGDGFGIAWYDGPGEPGLFKGVVPAWSDANLPGLCRMVRSPHFLAHVRAATQGEVSRANCHPFVLGRWAFAHNGAIGDYAAVRRRLEASLDDRFYAARRGTTDSELFFMIMLDCGLELDPPRAIATALERVRAVVAERGQTAPIRMTCALTDGVDIHAFRFADDDRSPTLYWSCDEAAQGVLVASEPLCANRRNWRECTPGRLYTISPSGVRDSTLN